MGSRMWDVGSRNVDHVGCGISYPVGIFGLWLGWLKTFGVWRLAFGVWRLDNDLPSNAKKWRLAFGVWRLALGIWRLALGVSEFGV